MNEFTYVIKPSVMFICLHDFETGKQIMINPTSIEMIKENKIFFRGHSTYVRESHEEIQNIFMHSL